MVRTTAGTPRISSIYVLIALIYLAIAVYAEENLTATNSVQSAATKVKRAATTYTVTVGKTSHQFGPEITKANVGDVLEFEFFSANHSVVRADFKHPCVPYELFREGKGFYSGFRPVEKNKNNRPTWHLTINDTMPIFYYCSAPSSCTQHGMIGVINPERNGDLEIQRSLALNSTIELQPGDPVPSEFASGSTSATPEATSPGAGGHQKLSIGAIVGIVIAVLVVVLISAIVCFMVGKNKARAQKESNSLMLPGGTSVHGFLGEMVNGEEKGYNSGSTTSGDEMTLVGSDIVPKSLLMERGVPSHIPGVVHSRSPSEPGYRRPSMPTELPSQYVHDNISHPRRISESGEVFELWAAPPNKTVPEVVVTGPIAPPRRPLPKLPSDI